MASSAPNNYGIKKVLFVLPSYLLTTLSPGNDGYKGTERSLVYILNEMNRLNIETHMIAPAGSDVEGTILHACCEMPHWDLSDKENPKCASPETIAAVRDNTIALMRQVAEQVKPDIIDCQIAHDEGVDAVLLSLGIPCVVTWHGPTNKPGLQAIVDKHPKLPVITVSKLQQEFVQANYVGVVPNGLPEDPPVSGDSGSGNKKVLAMMGRLSPKKDYPRGIEIASRTGFKLVIAGTLLPDQNDIQWFREVLEPLLKKHQDIVSVRYDVTESNQSQFFADVAALLALTKGVFDEWGIVYIEADGMQLTKALQKKRPVITDEGVDPAKVPPSVGFRVKTIDEAVDAVHKLDTIDPEDCRKHFQENYTIGKTAGQRLQIYVNVIRTFNEGK